MYNYGLSYTALELEEIKISLTFTSCDISEAYALMQ